MIEGKGLGDKKINRRSVSLSNHYDSNLVKLATALNMKPASLESYFIEKCLDDIPFINALQDRLCIQKAYRVLPLKNNGKIHYTLTGRTDA